MFWISLPSPDWASSPASCEDMNQARKCHCSMVQKCPNLSTCVQIWNCVAAATPFTSKPKASNVDVLDMSLSCKQNVKTWYFSICARHPFQVCKWHQLTCYEVHGCWSHFFVLLLWGFESWLKSQSPGDQPPLSQVGFIDCHHISMSIASCIACHLFKPNDQLFYEPLTAVWVLIAAILIGKAQQIHLKCWRIEA